MFIFILEINKEKFILKCKNCWMKDFNNWNIRKIKIDQNKNFNHPRAREIWWCSIGINIGSESFGKGTRYTRPVLVINNEGGEMFIGIPLTSKIKNRKYSCVIKTNDNILHTALVYQIRSFDKRRLTERKYILSQGEYIKVLDCLGKICKI